MRDKFRVFPIITIILLTLAIVLPLISAYGFFDWGYYGYSPSELLENEWVVFGGVFLLSFAIIFIALSNQFQPKEKQTKSFRELMLQDTSKNPNKPAIAVISAIIAFFISASLVRHGLLESYLGEFVSFWVFIFVLIVMIILLIPFFKALKKNVGTGIAFIIASAVLWIILRMIDPYQILPYNWISYRFEEIYEVLTSYTVLIILIIIGIALTSSKKR